MADFEFKKKWGQNFLRNEGICLEMITELQLNPKDIVLEIGPGNGQLSQFLAEMVKKLILVEIDPELVEQLRERFALTKNVIVIEEDILQTDLAALKGKYKFNKVIGALPYNISKPIIAKVVATVEPLTELSVLMIQKEVAESYAKTSKKQSVLHCYLSQFSEIKLIRHVEKSNFTPEPKVTSSIITFERKQLNPIWNENNLLHFEDFLYQVFQEPRKKLLKNLKRNFMHKDPATILTQQGISIDTRIEQLTVEQILALFLQLAGNK